MSDPQRRDAPDDSLTGTADDQLWSKEEVEVMRARGKES